MTDLDRLLIAVITGAFVGLVLWGLAVILGPALMAIAAGAIVASVAVRQRK